MDEARFYELNEKYKNILDSPEDQEWTEWVQENWRRKYENKQTDKEIM